MTVADVSKLFFFKDAFFFFFLIDQWEPYGSVLHYNLEVNAHIAIILKPSVRSTVLVRGRFPFPADEHTGFPLCQLPDGR